MAYPVESASLCAGSKRFAAGGGDMWAHLYNFEDGQELQCNKGGHVCHSLSECMLVHFSSCITSSPSLGLRACSVL